MTPQVWGTTPQVSHRKAPWAIICVGQCRAQGLLCDRRVLQETQGNFLTCLPLHCLGVAAAVQGLES